MKNQTKAPDKSGQAAAPGANLTPEQQENLLFIAKSGYNPEKLRNMLMDFKLIGEEEFSNDLLNCVGLILSNSEDLNTDEIISTHRCFELARTLRALRK